MSIPRHLDAPGASPETHRDVRRPAARFFRALYHLPLLLAVLCLGAATQAQTQTQTQEQGQALAQKSLRGDPEAAREAWQLIEGGALVIDVRSAEEVAAGALDGALHIPYDDTEALKQAIGEDRSRSVVMYCGSGRRVGIAIEALEADGYTGLFNGTGLDALEATRP